MGTAGPTANLYQMKENVQEKGSQMWTKAQDKVQEYNEKIQQNVELGKEKVKDMTPGPLHELGARAGLVEPTMTEEIKFGAEKMGTAGPTSNLYQMKENVQEKGSQMWTNTQDKVKEYNEKIQQNVEFGKEKVKEMTPAPLHELGARVGLVEPTMAEEIKFGAEKMGTAVSTSKLNEIGEMMKENVAVGVETAKEKSAQLWRATQEKVSGLNEKIKENVDFGWQKMMEATETPGPLHELGARVGLVQPTMSEEIKFGAEKMGTAGPTAQLNEMKENVQEKGAQVWTKTQDKVQEYNEKIKENVELGKEKVKESTETPGPLHELGARVGLVEPTMSEEIKFGAEKMGTAGPTAKLNEIGAKTKENVDFGIDKLKGATENLQEKSKQVWNKTQDKAHEHVARIGLVEPTMSEEIKFASEKMGTGKELEMKANLGNQQAEEISFESGKRPTV